MDYSKGILVGFDVMVFFLFWFKIKYIQKSTLQLFGFWDPLVSIQSKLMSLINENIYLDLRLKTEPNRISVNSVMIRLERDNRTARF